MFLVHKLQNSPLTFHKTELATAKHGKGAVAGTSKQPLISGNHNYRSEQTARHECTFTVKKSCPGTSCEACWIQRCHFCTKNRCLVTS